MSGCRCGRGAVAAPAPWRCRTLTGAAAPTPWRPVVADVDGSDADRGEAEPFTAKRSGTG